MMRAISAAVVTAVLLVPTAASAQESYPPPGDPGQGPKGGQGKAQKFRVCKQGCRYGTIAAALKQADGADTIRVGRGTYREGLQVVGKRYDGLKLIGNSSKPGRVVLNGKKLKRGAAQNAVLVNGADDVTIRGFHARNYKANCFFVTNADGYTLDRLVAERCGVYGVYAFNSKGGRMTNSEAYYNNDAGFYIGQTPPQGAKKKRSLVKNVTAWGNVLGFSGTNMKYVTITKSRWYNNGTGIVPNALDSEKFAPPEFNVIANNDIFWNNFNFYYGAPFEIPGDAAAGFAGYPIGVGILLFGSQDTTVENNRIYGHYLGGFAAIPQLQLQIEHGDDPKLLEASVLRNNVVRGNQFGREGSDRNARDMAYNGSGTGNCFADNVTFSPNVPSSGSTLAPCPGPAQNTVDDAVLGEILPWATEGKPNQPATFEKYWIKNPHSTVPGVQPLERFDSN